MSCLDENAAVELVLGDAGTEEAAQRRAHVARCEACRSLVGGVARVVLSGSRADDEGWLDAAEPLPAGTRVGSYTVLGVLGRGGMGVVHVARHDRLRRNVALKLLRADAWDSAGVDRLRREAQLLARLCHPNVVTVHDVGLSERGPFLAMELVEGMDLRRFLSAQPRRRDEILQVFREAGRGLAAAHEAGLVHRDFKPANVLVGTNPEGSIERVLVADFGLATASREAARAEPTARALMSTISTGRAWIGTPAYMAPEQLLGADADARADQFSFCVALHEALYGARPFTGTTAEELLASMRAGTRERVHPAIRRGLAFEPANRFASMPHLLEALERKPFRLPALVVAVAAVIVGAALWPREAADPCAERAEADGWTGSRRAEVEGALTSTSGGPDAATMLARLDDYAQAWRDAYAHTCGTEDADIDLTMACLRARRDELAGITGALAHADARARADLHRAAGRLGPPGDCLDDTYLSARFSADASLQAELSQLTTHAERAHAIRSDEIFTVVEPALADFRRRAEAADQPVLAAEAVRLQAVAEIYRDDPELADRRFEDAFFLAELGGDHRLAFGIATDGAMIGGIVGDPNRTRRWNERARALLEHVPSPRHQLDLAIREADVLLAEERPEEALELLAAAEAWFDDATDEAWAEFLDKRAQAKMGTHDTRGAGEDWALALRLLEDAFGPDHPDVLTPLNGLAITQIMRHENEAAAANLERALAVQQGENTTRHAYLLANLALLHEEMGELERAVDELLEVDRIFEQHLGLGHPQSVRTAANLARICDRLGRVPEAERYAKRALENAGDVLVPYREDLERIVATKAARGAP